MANTQPRPPGNRATAREAFSAVTMVDTARVVKLVDTADLKSADAETRRAGSTPALGTH